MTRKRPDVQVCGERHESYRHCAVCCYELTDDQRHTEPDDDWHKPAPVRESACDCECHEPGWPR